MRAVINMAIMASENLRNKSDDSGLCMLCMHLTKGLKISRRRNVRKDILFVSSSALTP